MKMPHFQTPRNIRIIIVKYFVAVAAPFSCRPSSEVEREMARCLICGSLDLGSTRKFPRGMIINNATAPIPFPSLVSSGRRSMKGVSPVKIEEFAVNILFSLSRPAFSAKSWFEYSLRSCFYLAGLLNTWQCIRSQ